MRSSCLDCIGKHVASAMIFLRESRTGYPAYRILAMAELEHASQESEKDYPEISLDILQERRAIRDDPEYHPELYSILEMIWERLEQEYARAKDRKAVAKDSDQEESAEDVSPPAAQGEA